MDNLFFSIIALLTTSPGNLVYHLVLGFSVIAALQTVILHPQVEQDAIRARTILGLSLLVLSQVGEFVATGLAWQGMVDLHYFIPPLDRAIILLSTTLVVWLWVFPKPNRVGDIITTLIIFAALIAFLLTLAAWSNPTEVVPFNGSWLDQLWILATGAIAAVGVLALLFKRSPGWGIGFAILMVNLLGLAAHFFWFDPAADFAGALRLAQLCTFPLLPALTLRMKQTPSKQAATTTSPVVFKERRKHSADPRTVQAWLDLATDQDSHNKVSHISRAVAQTMFADLCYLVTCPTQQDNLTLVGGYDLIREQPLQSLQIDRQNVSSIANAVTRARTLRLGGENGDAPDLSNLAREIGLENCGNICLIPLTQPDRIWGAILLLSPYSNRNWTPDDQAYLSSSITNITQLLTRPSSIPEESNPQPEPAITSQVVDELIQQLETLKQENNLLLNEISIIRQDGQEESSREMISTLQFQSAHPDQETLVEQMGDQLRYTQQEVTRLQSLLAETQDHNRPMDYPQTLPKTTGASQEEIISIVQELRQPLATLTGYTDLILSESAGILVGLQRKFMERIRVSSERLQALLDELVQIATHPAARISHAVESIAVSEVLDGVIAENRAQIQEKNITFQIDFPDVLPEINFERDAFVQIVFHLVQNAILASPYEGVIRLRCNIEAPDSSSSCFLFQVTDSGGGIDPADLPQVFSKRIKAEDPLIQGVGDRGIGLSIAKTLVEAHQGRIWVDSDPNKTTTISILIPTPQTTG